MVKSVKKQTPEQLLRRVEKMRKAYHAIENLRAGLRRNGMPYERGVRHMSTASRERLAARANWARHNLIAADKALAEAIADADRGSETEG